MSRTAREQVPGLVEKIDRYPTVFVLGLPAAREQPI